MQLCNQDIRKAIDSARLPKWRVAYKYGVNDATFSRYLRTELPEEKKQEFLKIIEELKNENYPNDNSY